MILNYDFMYFNYYLIYIYHSIYIIKLISGYLLLSITIYIFHSINIIKNKIMILIIIH